LPWPEAADGDGASLQRLCPTGSPLAPENWDAPREQLPTPLASNANTKCPPPAPFTPAVVINEIHYHPARDRDAQEEYVELYNPGPDRVSLAGWMLRDGIDFTFSATASIGPGEFLVVCRDRDYIQGRFGLTSAVGNFTGKLANSGERLALVTSRGDQVDAVSYRDSGEWPYGADGLGRSLEKVVATAPGDDPASWASSIVKPGDFIHLDAVGPIGPLTFKKLLFGINGVGEYIVDNIVLEPVGQPGVNLIVNGDFEQGLGTWVPQGNALASRVEDRIGVGGSKGFRLTSSGGCPTECGSQDSVSYAFSTANLDPEARVRLSLDYRYLSGSTEFYAKVLRGVEVTLADVALTPGRPNSRSHSW
jgi:hypothetical protein